MDRVDAKKLINLLSIVVNSSRHEQAHFKAELGAFKSELSHEDVMWIISLEGALDNLLYDLREVLETSKKKVRATISDDSFDRFGY